MNNYQPIVEELITLLNQSGNCQMKTALMKGIKAAEILGYYSLTDYYHFLDEMVTLIPTDRNLLPWCLNFYYFIDQAPKFGEPKTSLKDHPLFQQWIAKFINTWGSFLNTTESAKGLDSLYLDPQYNVDDFVKGPSGWLTFNQFFARHIKPGKRPVQDILNNSVIVSPADSQFRGYWAIDDNPKVTVKGLNWTIPQLLDLDPKEHPVASKELKEKFAGGTYTHSYLSAHDYHRFHVPVGGTIKYAYHIAGKINLDVIKYEDGSLGMTDGDSWQHTQVRGLIVIDTGSDDIGYIAVLPIGMGEVSSVTLTVEPGTKLTKGDEFGYFAFGGSDIVMVFEKKAAVKFTAVKYEHYNQGQQIAKVG